MSFNILIFSQQIHIEDIQPVLVIIRAFSEMDMTQIFPCFHENEIIFKTVVHFKVEDNKIKYAQ